MSNELNKILEQYYHSSYSTPVKVNLPQLKKVKQQSVAGGLPKLETITEGA